MAATTDHGQMAGLITTSIRRKFIPRLVNRLQFDPLAAKGKLEMRGGSKTLRWNLMSDIGVFTTELGETTTTQNEVTTITVTSTLQTVNDYGAFVKMSDLADSVWTRETREEHADIFAYSGAKTRDTLLRNVADDTTTFLVSQETATGTGILATTDTAIAQDLNTLRGRFNQNDADEFDHLNGNYAVIIHGKVEQDMVADVTTARLSWSPLIQNVNPQAERITNYKGPGALLGMAVMRSNNITTTTLTNTVTAYVNIALADHGIGKTTINQSEPRVIMKRPGPSTVSVPLDTYGIIGWKMRMAQSLLSNDRAIIYYTAI